jgi:hypothetical protein
MNPLKLVALDQDDLTVVSAHVQDAVMKIGDLDFFEARKLFVMPMNRFAWEKNSGFLGGQPERRNSVLHFNRVLSVKTTGLALDRPADIVSLLAVRFTAADAPAGMVDLVFAGGGVIRLEVECIEARLTDLGGAWEASSRPAHKV